MTSINNYQCHYTLIKKMMTSKPEDRLRKNGVKTRKYYKWLRWSMKNIFILFKKFCKRKMKKPYYQSTTLIIIRAVIN